MPANVKFQFKVLRMRLPEPLRGSCAASDLARTMQGPEMSAADLPVLLPVEGCVPSAPNAFPSGSVDPPSRPLRACAGAGFAVRSLPEDRGPDQWLAPG
eukprot:1258706-Alexandrium_andersonii.AAC.1